LNVVLTAAYLLGGLPLNKNASEIPESTTSAGDITCLASDGNSWEGGAPVPALMTTDYDVRPSRSAEF